MDYKAKYLKYKAKYLKNKLIGGANLNMQPNAIYKEVIFGLNVLQTKEGEYLPSNTNLYYKLNNEYVLVGTLDDIKKNNNKIGTGIFKIIINDKEEKKEKELVIKDKVIREYSKIFENTPEVKLYYNENELPVKPPVELPVKLPVKPPVELLVKPPDEVPVKLVINPRESITDPAVRDRIFPDVLPEGIPQPGDFSFIKKRDRDGLTNSFKAILQIEGGFESLIPKPGETIPIVPPRGSILEKVSKALFKYSADRFYTWIMIRMEQIASFGWVKYVQDELEHNREVYEEHQARAQDFIDYLKNLKYFSKLITNSDVRTRIFPDALPEGIPKPGNFIFMDDENRDLLERVFKTISDIKGGFEALIPKPGETIPIVPPPGSILERISDNISSSITSNPKNLIWIMSEMQGIATFGWIQYVQLVRNREGNPKPVPEGGREIETKTRTNVNFSTELEFCPICFDRLDSFDRSDFLEKTETKTKTKTETKTETKIKHTICKVSESVDCGHIFHCECIKNWTSDRRDCPVCRKEIRKLEELNYSNNKLIGGALSYINSRGY